MSAFSRRDHYPCVLPFSSASVVRVVKTRVLFEKTKVLPEQEDEGEGEEEEEKKKEEKVVEKGAVAEKETKEMEEGKKEEATEEK